MRNQIKIDLEYKNIFHTPPSSICAATELRTTLVHIDAGDFVVGLLFCFAVVLPSCSATLPVSPSVGI
jgi:hypothetical protein